MRDEYLSGIGGRFDIALMTFRSEGWQLELLVSMLILTTDQEKAVSANPIYKAVENLTYLYVGR